MKVEVKKSIEGGKYKNVIIEDELFDALLKYDKLSDTFNFLFVNGLIDTKSELFNNLNKIGDECRNIFRKYNLDKYDVRSIYMFNEAKRLEE
jgi:hypothetical protein